MVYWKKLELEKVKEFTYLGVKLYRNGSLEKHIQERAKKANIVLNQIWSIGERKFKNDFKRSMFMFDYLIASAMLYGSELYEWKEISVLESIQLKYIKRCLRLDRCTPSYIVLEETKRDKIRIRTGKRALNFEGVRKAEKRVLFKEYLKKEKGNTNTTKEREEYYRKNGYSELGFNKLREEDENFVKILVKRE